MPIWLLFTLLSLLHHLADMKAAITSLCKLILNSIKQIKARSPVPCNGAVFLSCIVAFPFFMHGYDVAIMRATSTIVDDLGLTVDQIDNFVTLVNRWPLCGGVLVSGLVTNFVGRKYTAAFGGGLYTIGVLMVAFAHGYMVAACGRALARFGTGMGLVVGPIYIAEIAPASVRSFLGHFPQVMMALGMIAAYTLEAAFTRVHPHIGWRLTIGLSALPSLAFTVVLCCLPDSPCWLVMLGKVDFACQLLEDCRGPRENDDDDSDEEEEEDNEVEIRMKQLKKIARLDPDCSGNHVRGAPRRIIGVRAVLRDTFNDQPVFRPMLKTIILLIAQEAIFEDLFLMTLGTALERNELRCCLSSSISGAMLSCIKLLATILSAHCANGLGGRKALLIISIFLAGCSLGAFSATLYADGHRRISHGMAFALYSAELATLEVAVGFGVGPYPWMYGPEAFPLPIRAPFLAFCICIKFALRLIANLLLPVVYAPFEGIWAAFLLASGMQALSLLLCCFFIRDSTGQILVDHID